MLAVVANKLLFNWFDALLALVLAIGFWRGRKHGMSREFLPVSKWLIIICAAGLANEWLGKLLIQQGLVKPMLGRSGFSEKTVAFISAYLLIALAIWMVFAYISHRFKKGLEGSNLFGSSEYYLGITSGVIRYACYAIFALAILNAPVYTAEEIAAKEAYNNRWYGGGVKEFKGDFIPSVDEVQVIVFRDSLLGPSIKKGIDPLLIHTAIAMPNKHSTVDIQQ